MDTTPPRTAPTADASTPPAGPVEIPAEFRSQRLRHKEYKRRGPVSGSRFEEEEIGETRTALSSRFFDAADEGASGPSAPPPPPPPPPPAVPTRASLPKRREVEGERSEAVPAAAAALGRAAPAAAETTTATGTAQAGEAGTGRATEAGVSTEGALEASAIKPRTGTTNTGDAATENTAEKLLQGGGKACAGGKRKVGPDGREEEKSESPRKVADNGGRCGDDAVSNSEHSVGEVSAAVKEEGAGVEPPAREPREDREGKGQGAGLRERSGEDCGPVSGSADNGGDDNDGRRKHTPRP